MKRWYVARTHARAEAQAMAHLARQGFQTYLPRVRKRRRHARRVDMVTAPLFPRYLFVAFDRTRDSWRAISSTIGVAQLLCMGETPLAVPEGVVAAIRARQGEDGLVALAPEPRFEKGAMVRIVAGPMSRQIGLFDGLSERDRVVVLLDLLGREIKVEMGDTAIAAYA